MTLFYITYLYDYKLPRQMGAKRGAAPSKARSPVLMRPSGKLISVSEAHSILAGARTQAFCFIFTPQGGSTLFID